MLSTIHAPAGIRMKSRMGRFGSRIEASPSKRRFLLGRSLRLEPLEDRSLLSISYVDNNLAHWTVTNDQSEIGTLDAGDTVTWNYGQSDAIGGLVYGSDAFSSIQEAIDAAAWGDTINVEAGTYAEQLTINKSLDLIGAGELTTTILAPATADRQTVTYGSTVHDYIVAAYATTTPTVDVRIEGFTIDANNTASKVSGTGWFDGVFLRDVNDDGGSVAGLFSSTIEGFTTTAYESWGTVVFGDSELTLHDNTIREFTRDGIDVFGTGGTTGQPNVTISDNVVAGSATGLLGIAIEDHAAATLTGNVVTGMARATPWAGVGILVWNADNVVVGGTGLGEGNQVDENYYGIFVNTSENVEVVGNELTHNINRAITLDDADDNTVARNIIVGTTEGTEDAGIALLNDATGNMIGGDTTADGNTITLATSGSHLLYAIYLPNNAGAGSNTIKNNSIQGGTRAVQVDTGNTGTTTIVGNTIGDVVAPSFGGIMANGGNLVVTGNTLTNAVRPIEFWGVGTATVTGNYIYGATFDAINVGSVATGSTFSNNTISGLGTDVTSKPTAGINVRNGNSGLVISGNQIDNMLYNGIQVTGGSGFTITDNVMSYLGSYVAEGLFGVGILLGAPQGEHGWYTGLGTHNSTVSGNEVSYSNEGIDLYYASNNQITGNNLHDLKNDGMWLQDASDNTITGNTVAGVRDGAGNGMGIAVYGTDLVGGVPADGGSDRNEITANTVTDCDYGLLALDLSDDNTFTNNVVNLNATAVGAWTYVLGRDPVDNVFHENDLSGNTQYFFVSDTIDASCNWFGTGVRASAVAAASTGISFVDISPMLDHGDSDTLTAGFQADYSSLTVTTLGAQLSGTRIQEGVNLVDDEGIVHVDAGTYVEQVTINKSLDLIGEGESSTIIQAPTAPRSGKISVAGSGIWDYILAAYATSDTIDVRVEGFMFDANDQNKTADTTTKFTGVFFSNVYDDPDDHDGTVAGLFSSTIHNFGTDLQNYGVRIYGQSKLTVDDNTVYEYTRDGITANGDDDSVTTDDPDVIISNNAVTGIGTVAVVQNGIQVAYGASGSITGNTVSNDTGDSEWWSTGILVSYTDNITVTNNTAIGNTTGVYVAFADNNTVSQNTFTNNVQAGVMVSNNDKAGPATTNNHIEDNTFTGGWAGIWSSYCAGNFYQNNIISKATGNAIYFWDTDNNTVSGNTISDIHDGSLGAWGIALDGGDTTGTVGSDGNTISGNIISDTDIQVWVGNGSDSNTVSGNTLSDGVIGIQASAYTYDHRTIAPSNITISGNTITDMTTGIDLVLGSATVSGNIFNGTTDNEVDLLLESTAGIVTIGPGNSFAGDTRYIENHTSQSFDLTGTNAQIYEETDNFRIEDKMYHALDNAACGLITWVADTLFVSTGGKIQLAVDAATSGDTAYVEAGTYTELLAINKSLDLIGEGSSTTTIDGDGGDTVVYIDSGSADWVVSLFGFTITGGESSNHGGGIYNDGGTLTVDNCIITGNSARQIGGGIFDNSTGTLTIKNSTISNNTSNNMGGGIGDWAGCTVIIENSTISDNAAFDGGGISAMQSTWTIRNTTIDGNSTYAEDGYGYGGGIMNWGSDVTLEGCTISNNTATYLGGGIQNQSTMTLISSTLFGNTALYGAGISSIHEITIQNSTIANNTATGAVDSSGGGILYQGIMTIANSTIAGNAAVQGGGIYNNATTIAEMVNSIVADNTSSDSSSPDIYGTITANYCLIGDMTGATLTDGSAHNLLDVDPLLGTLGYYESGIQTIPLLKGSPALNAGSNALIPSGMTTDERGFNRIFRVIVDMGAHEVSDPSVFGTLPVVTLTAPAYTNNTTPTVYIHATPGDEGKLPSGTTVYLDVDLNDDSDYEDPGEQAYCTGTLDENGDSVIIVTPALAQGSYEMKARVTDTLYNEGISIPTNVVIDLTAPTVTANRASTQPETTSKSPIYFTVVFSKIVTGFSASGVIFSGTAPGTLSAVVTGSGTTYTVAVSGMTGTGTVTVSLKAGAAHDLAGNASEASTSTHNSVNFIAGPAISNVSVSAKTSSENTNITFKVVDNKGISSVQLKIDGKNVSIRKTSGDKYSATYAYSGLLTASTHTYTIRAVSSRGTSTYTNSFTVAASTPTISSVSVIASKSDKPATFSWRVFTIDGIRAVKISIDGGTAVTVQKSSGSSTSATYLYSALLSARTHTYTITAVGATGKAATPYTGRVTVVGTTPLIVNVKATAKTSSNNTTIKWTVYDIDGIGSTTLKIDGRKITSGITHTGSSTYITYTYTGKLSAGRHSYTINATDASVPQVAAKQFSGNVTVAASVPTITHVVVTPTKSRTTITWTASDIDGMKSVVLKIDGRGVTITKSGDNYSYSGKLSVGRYTYSITATSTLNKSATVSGNLIVRNTLSAPHSSFATALSKTNTYSHSLLDDETTASIV